jgi:membrane AbrB-like protein
MSAVSETGSSGWRLVAAWPFFVRWGALVLLAAFISILWGAVGLPASLLFGPMFGGAIFAVNGVSQTVPRWLYLAAQAVIGAMVSANITPAIVATLGHDILLFGIVTGTILVAAAALGWLVSRSGLIPGSTAVYGISPGAAVPMVLLSEASGADAHLVAFMQYSRVLLVALVAALVAHLGVGAVGSHASRVPWLVPVHWDNLAVLAVLAAIGQQAARLLRVQGWALLGPMILLSALHAGGLLAIDLPRWLLAVAYVILGLHIGCGFRREGLFHAGQALPVVVGSALFLIGFCGLVAWGLARLVHIDALTAYLATSPGGIDTVAVIAAATPRVDLPFVLALQSVRLLIVVGLAPAITRWVVRYSPHLRKMAR